jgi:hypothetical protein
MKIWGAGGHGRARTVPITPHIKDFERNCLDDKEANA